jgi:hypothetical protein
MVGLESPWGRKRAPVLCPPLEPWYNGLRAWLARPAAEVFREGNLGSDPDLGPLADRLPAGTPNGDANIRAAHRHGASDGDARTAHRDAGSHFHPGGSI